MRSINKIIAVLLVMVMTLSILPVSAFTASAATTSDPAPSVSAAIKRLGGADRYETSTKIAQEGWTSADTVVLASADSYADALAGAPLARAKDAPIILVSGKSVNAKVMAQIKDLGAKNVYLLGGTAAISAEIEAELTKAGYTVIRLWDSTRYGTAVAVAKELVKINGNPSEVFIASGVNYPDALSASSIAGIKGVPILYAPANGVLDDATIAFIKSAAPGKAFILGGTAAIDNAVVGKLTNAGVASTERLGGDDRYDTSLIITKKFDSVFTSKDISIATGKNYPDALAGGAFSAKKGIPVLLTDNETVNSDLKAYIAGKNPAVAYVFGGESVVSDVIVKAYLPVPAPTTTTTESTTTTTTTTTAPSVPVTPAPAPSVTRYKVSFDANGENVENMPSAQRVKKGQRATEPADPTREGYTFDGWYTEAKCENEFDFATKITKKITLYAKWVEETTVPTPPINPDTYFTVTFYTNGGSEIAPQTVYEGYTAFRPAIPTKEGSVFENWYIDEALNTEYDFNTPVTANIYLYAKWHELSVQIAIDDGNYADNVINRTITGTVTSNQDIESVSYVLTGSVNSVSDSIVLSNGNFSVDVSLEDGENVFIVTVKTADGTETTESVTLTYDSGNIYDDGTYDENDDRRILIPVTFDDNNEPYEWFLGNLLNIYFVEDYSFEDRQSFITDVLKGEVAGYLNAIDMMQIWLPNPLEIPDGIDYTGETDLEKIAEDELNQFAEKLAEKYDFIDSVDLEYVYEVASDAVDTNDTWNNPSVYHSTSEAIDDPDSGAWWLEYSAAIEAWEYNNFYNSDFFKKNVKIGVVDSGVNSAHEDLANVITISKENSPERHGTHVAGIIAATADNGTGIAGMMYNNNVSILNYDAYAVSTSGKSTTSSSKILEGITKCVEHGAKVINNSNGLENMLTTTSQINRSGKEASKIIGLLLKKGKDFIVVQAAGNDGVDYPGNGAFCSINSTNCYSTSGVSKQDIMDRVLIVASIGNSYGELAYYSNGGSGGVNIIAAPGTDVLSCNTGNNSYVSLSGTSMAAPVVTGACGLVWSVNSNLSGAQVVDIIMGNTTGTAITNSNSNTTGGMGIINTVFAVEDAIDTLPTYYGTVVDATTGEEIEAEIKIYNGIDDEGVGPLVGKEQVYKTNSNGRFSLPKLPGEGYYTLHVSADGYVSNHSSYYLRESLSQESDANLGIITLSKVVDDDTYVITLSWGQNPNDLDLHLVSNLASTGELYHLFFPHRIDTSEGLPPHYATLDTDDTSSYGPEHITITNFSGLTNVRFAIHDFSNGGETNSYALSNSGATVTVQKGSELVGEFSVPINKVGTEWRVFALDASGNVVEVNEMVNDTGSDRVWGATSSINDEGSSYSLRSTSNSNAK